MHSHSGHVQQTELLKLWQFIHQNSELFFFQLEKFFFVPFFFFMANLLPPSVSQFSVPFSPPPL